MPNVCRPIARVIREEGENLISIECATHGNTVGDPMNVSDNGVTDFLNEGKFLSTIGALPQDVFLAVVDALGNVGHDVTAFKAN